ncbi:MAG TPA: protein-disulfide reductase DsbD domain-containing protein, partial [Acetobacteraceae bacterium]
MIRVLLSCLALLLPALLPAGAQARESAAVASSRATVTLVSDTDTIEPGTPFRVGLRIRLAPGWHTYWKNPGDAGVPPDLSFDNAKVSDIDWPTPRRVAEGSVMTYAYTQAVLLPVTATAEPGVLKAHAQWLVCKDICVPEEGDFSLDLPAGNPAPSPEAPLFAAHDQTVPRPSPFAATIAPDGTLFVQAPSLSPNGLTGAVFIPEAPGQIQDDAAQPLSIRGDGFTLALKLSHGFSTAKGLSGLLLVRDQTGGENGLVLSAKPGVAPAPDGLSLPHVLLFAFLGGLILNLMPCVFPILAMKAVTLVDHRHRAHSIAYTAGVVVTFTGLAAALLVARAAGTAAGWGFQFSAPVLVAIMAWLLFAVGLNLSGIFEVGGSLVGAGSRLAERGGVLGSFFTGLLAVLVATPCTAPFMGAAIAAGLAAPAVVTVLVFAVMGLGLAAPYVALASVPGLAHLLPRPGHWMVIFKQVLAFPMYGGAVWLLWVVSQEAGPSGVVVCAGGMVLIGYAAWVMGITQGIGHAQSRSAGRFARASALAALLTAGAMLPGLSGAPAAPAAAADPYAEAFTPARLAALRDEGRPVFVNMTAAWCVTCLVNER